MPPDRDEPIRRAISTIEISCPYCGRKGQLLLDEDNDATDVIAHAAGCTNHITT